MIYQQLSPQIHLICQPLDRFRVEIEIVLHAAGSLFEESQDRGKKHLLEHCIASRTRELDFQALKDFQFSQNLLLNAYTGPQTMGLTASSHRDDFEKALELLWQMATSPTFDQSILEREREIVLREISERRGDPAYELHYFVQNQIFTTDSVEVHEVLGSSDQVAQTTLADFAKLHRQNLQDSQIIIQVSGGGIDLELIKKICQPLKWKVRRWFICK